MTSFESVMELEALLARRSGIRESFMLFYSMLKQLSNYFFFRLGDNSTQKL